ASRPASRGGIAGGGQSSWRGGSMGGGELFHQPRIAYDVAMNQDVEFALGRPEQLVDADPRVAFQARSLRVEHAPDVRDRNERALPGHIAEGHSRLGRAMHLDAR